MIVKSIVSEVLNYYSTLAQIAKSPGNIPTREKKQYLRYATRLNIQGMLGNRARAIQKCAEIGSLRINYSDSSLFSYNLVEVFVREEYFFRSEKQDPVIIDCGSNIGLASLYFKRVFPDARITAIEAHPDTFALLKSNVEANSIDSVTLVNAALVNDDCKTVELFSSGAGDLRSTVAGELRSSEHGVKSKSVNALRLSTLLPKHVDLLKIDIEGLEVDVIEEVWDRLDAVDQILFEYHFVKEKGTKKLGMLLNELELKGFDCRVAALDHLFPRVTFQESSFALTIGAKRRT